MGNMCCELFNSIPTNPASSLPNLILYKKNDVSTVNYSRFSSEKSIDDDISECIPSPVEVNSSNQMLPTIDNYIVVWLTSSIDEHEYSFEQLRRIVHSFRIFIDIDEFFSFLVEIKDEKLCLIISNIFARNIISIIHQMSSLMVIYIISNDDQSNNRQWINEYEKIKGIFTHIEPICEQLKRILHLSEYDIQPIEILNPSSVVIQWLIKQILLSEIDYPEKLKRDFIDYARQQYPNELNVINEFAEKYTPSSAIWWYTRKCFLYSLMSKIFHTDNIELLMKMGFFIRDLHQQEFQHSIPMIVYCGQGILENKFETIKNGKNALLFFKNCLWTNTDQTSSLNAARLARNNPNLLGILFHIEINSMRQLISLDKISYYFNCENQYLFSIYSLFRIDQIKQIEDQIWQIDLSLINNDDQQFKDYLQPIENNHEQTSWQRLGLYLIQINQYDKAEEFYKILIELNLISNPKHSAFLNEQLAMLYQKQNDSIHSILYYKKSLKDYLTIRSSNDPYLVKIYFNIGLLFHQQNHFNEAIKHFKYALNIALHSSPLNRRQISILYHHIASIYDQQEIFVEAIQNYQSALENELNRFPIHHSSIAKTYNKIGEIFYRMGDYTRAFSYFDKTLQIQKKSLSPNHSILANTNYNIALVLNGLQQYKEAIEYASRAANIARHSFGSNHNDVQLYEEYLEKLRKKTFVGVIPNGAVYG